MTTRPITDDQAQALAAWAQWNLGAPSWARQIADVLANPHAVREALKREGLSVSDIDTAFRSAFPDRYDRLTQKGTASIVSRKPGNAADV